MDEKEEGVKAIIYLQSLAGIVEPEERAAENWDGFADWEKDQTLRTYRMLKPKGLTDNDGRGGNRAAI